jgi:hypothetical protein
MDKPRWALTWSLAALAVILSYHDSFWWAILKMLPFCVGASLIEHYRSDKRNEETPCPTPEK